MYCWREFDFTIHVCTSATWCERMYPCLLLANMQQILPIIKINKYNGKRKSIMCVLYKGIRKQTDSLGSRRIIGGRLSSLRVKKWSPWDGVGIFELSLMWGFRICAFWHMYDFCSQNPRFFFFIFDVLTLDFLNGFWLKIIALYIRNKNKRDVIKRMKIKKVMVTFYNHGRNIWHRL